MSAVKKTISMPKKLLEKGQARAQQLHYATFSDYIQELIRRDSAATDKLQEDPVPYKVSEPPPAQPQVKLPHSKGQKADKN